MFEYYVIYKPFGMLSQFSKEGEHATLADLKFNFSKDVYPVGRLDSDSEGLLILTNDKSLNHKLLNPKFKHNRSYLVQLEGIFNNEAVAQIAKGVEININGTLYNTSPAKVEVLQTEPIVPERFPNIRFRKNIPVSWIKITLHEGKNRQVRKMTAKVGFPTLRLIRVAIENVLLDDMKPGDVKQIQQYIIMNKLKL
jgi:23S rRNA pseudouridine2457 synthase